jgi:pyruvate dehydrogenase E1 component
VARSEGVASLPAREGVARSDGVVSRRYITLGTDGFGRSDTRAALRSFFEVDRHHVVIAALKALADEGTLDRAMVKQALLKYEVDPDKPNPWDR